MKRGLYVLGGYTPGQVITAFCPTPGYEAGDDQFLDADPARFVQLRPILKAEQTPGRLFGPSDRMVVYRGQHWPELRAFVRMKPGERENTPRNVRRAIRQIVKFNRSVGEAFERAERGLPPDSNGAGGHA